MRKQYITHDNLRKILEDIHENGLNENNLKHLKDELKHSSLIIAADISSDEIRFRLLEEEGQEYGILFTDMNEFRKCFSDEECGSYYYDFEAYKRIVAEGVLDGFLINPQSEGFIFQKDLFLEIDNFPEHKYTPEHVYSSEELKHIKDSIDNSELEKFIQNPDNIGKYEELFEKIASSTLLTLMLSSKDLTNQANNGVISMLETGPLAFLYIDEIGGDYATVYTSEDKISNVSTKFSRYSQIVNFSQMTNFILNDDMQGIIINPNSENILLTRDVLLEYSSLLEDTCNDPRLNSAIFYMFIINKKI